MWMHCDLSSYICVVYRSNFVCLILCIRWCYPVTHSKKIIFNISLEGHHTLHITTIVKLLPIDNKNIKDNISVLYIQ